MSEEIENLKAAIQAELLATQAFAALSAVLMYSPSVPFRAESLGLSVPAEQAEKFSAAFNRISDMARAVACQSDQSADAAEAAR